MSYEPKMIVCPNCRQESPDDDWSEDNECPMCGVMFDEDAAEGLEDEE